MNSNWLYTITLPISNDENWNAQKNLCNAAIKELKRIIPLIDQSQIEGKEHYFGALGNMVTDFEMRLLDVEDMDIEDSIEECNYLLENLYDIGDSKVKLNGELRKFICVKNSCV